MLVWAQIRSNNWSINRNRFAGLIRQATRQTKWTVCMRRETKSFKRSLRAETEGFPNFESSAKNPNKNLRVFLFSIKHRETAMWRNCDCSSPLRIQAVEFLVNLLMSVPTHLPHVQTLLYLWNFCSFHHVIYIIFFNGWKIIAIWSFSDRQIHCIVPLSDWFSPLSRYNL